MVVMKHLQHFEKSSAIKLNVYSGAGFTVGTASSVVGVSSCVTINKIKVELLSYRFTRIAVKIHSFLLSGVHSSLPDVEHFVPL